MFADTLFNTSLHDVECSALTERQQFSLKIKHFTITECKRIICKENYYFPFSFIYLFKILKIIILMYNMFSHVQNKERNSKCYCFVIDAGISQPLSDSVIS